MRSLLLSRALAPGALLLTGVLLPHALAQGSAPASANQKNCDIKSLDDKSCAQPKPAAPPSAAQQFPYPGAQPAQPPSDAATPAPASPQAPPPGSAAKQFPYPGDAPSGPSSSSSSSSSSGAADSADPDDPLDPDSKSSAASKPDSTGAPTGRRKLPKVTNLQNDDDREAEDVKVARFYHDDGNNLAAYNRLKDATKLITDDPDAWYLLGEVAAKMKKSDESRQAYQQFLKLEPDTHRAKALQHAQPELRARQ